MTKIILAVSASSLFALTTLAKEVTEYPAFHGKSVTKLCYNTEKDNFTYTKKTIFGNIKTKEVSRIQFKKGDCIETDIISHGGKDGDVVEVCVKKAQKNIYYPLTVVASVYDVEEICENGGGSDDHGGRTCHDEKTLINTFNYTIKNCK